jgi:segregation and condensation protein A
MSRIHARLCEQRQLAFRELFQPGLHKSALVGIFLAVLELVRHHHVGVEQQEAFAEIWLNQDHDFSKALDLSGVDNYDHARPK